MTGRRLPKKVFFYLVPAAISAFCTRTWQIPPPHPPSYYGREDYKDLSVFIGLALGVIAAVAVVIFLLLGALIKAIFSLVGTPLERRFGTPTRQIVAASMAGLITGVMIYLFPLACGSGKDGMMPTMTLTFDKQISVPYLIGLAIAKVVAYWACAHGGLVGGIFYPLLYYGLTLGEICQQVFKIDALVALPVMIGATPGALLPAPITALAFPVCMFVTGPTQTVPILTAIVIANAILVGSGFLEKMMSRKQ